MQKSLDVSALNIQGQQFQGFNTLRSRHFDVGDPKHIFKAKGRRGADRNKMTQSQFGNYGVRSVNYKKLYTTAFN